MKRINSYSLEIDGARFQEALQKRGIKISEASKKCGYKSESAISKWISGNFIPNNMVMTVKYALGIEAEEYEVINKPLIQQLNFTSPEDNAILEELRAIRQELVQIREQQKELKEFWR